MANGEDRQASERVGGSPVESSVSVAASSPASLLRDACSCLESRFREALSLQELDRDLSGDAFIRTVMDGLFDCLRSLISYDRLGLALLSDGGLRLRGCWSRTVDTGVADALAGHEADVASSSLRRLLLTGRPRVINDLRHFFSELPDSDSTRRALAAGVRSNLAFPVTSLGRPVGVLFFSSHTPNAYRGVDLDTFGVAAEHVGRIIEMGRLYQHILTIRAGALSVAESGADVASVVRSRQGSTKVLEKRVAVCVEPDATTRRVFDRAVGHSGLECVLCADLGELEVVLNHRFPDVLIVSAAACDGAIPETVGNVLNGRADGHAPALIMTCAEGDRTRLHYCIMCQEADDVLLLPFTPVDLDTRIRLAMKRRFMKNAGRSGPRRGGMFAGRYKVDREIYCGSYSSVYLAFDISVGGHSDPVALKIYSPSPVQTRSGKFISLFLHETHRHFHLNHPKITRLLDFGQTNGLYFLVTEYVPGESLADILATRGALEQSALIRIGVDIAEVLIHLQHKGLIHRDVKPDNIIVTPEGDARLIDFGLARSQDDLPAAPHDTIDGTPMYVAPELIWDAAVADSPADVYALGITLFHAATGRFPFADTDDSDRAERGLTDIPLSLRDAAPGVEPALSQLVDRMLASQPGRRPTPEQLRNALLRLME